MTCDGRGRPRVGPSVSYPVTEAVTVGVESFWPLAVLPVADESGGTYFSAAETDRLRLLFGGGSREFEGENLTVGTRNTFITAGVELTASPGQANRVAVKPGADYQVATGDWTLAITSWRFGLVRVVSVTAYGEEGSLDGLLGELDSLVVTRSVNYAIGLHGSRGTC